MVFVKRSLPVLMVALAALSARADTLNVVANGSVGSNAGSGGNGFYMATYADSSTLQAFGAGQVGVGNSVLYFPEFALPTGAVVTGASLSGATAAARPGHALNAGGGQRDCVNGDVAGVAAGAFPDHQCRLSARQSWQLYRLASGRVRSLSEWNGRLSAGSELDDDADG
jgi:hypothetical protein